MFCWALVIPLAVVLTDGLVAAQTESLTCPDGYILNAAENNKTCFRVFEDRYVTRSEARDSCRASVEDGDLLQVDSIESNQMVADKLSRGKRYWIGVIKYGNDDAIIDATESPVPFEAPWAWGEPNDHGKQGERCVEMIGNRRGAWNDKRCDKKRPFVCQTPAVTITVDKAIQPTAYDIVSCDFETECSNYKIKAWTVETNVGSLVDHTLQTPEGHFLKNSQWGSSPPTIENVNLTEPSCLTCFFVGTDMQAILTSNGTTQTLQGPIVMDPKNWTKSMWNVPPSERTLITFKVDNSRMGPQALDDIRLVPGHCDV